MEWLPACDSADMQGQSQIAALVNPAAVDPLNQKRFHETEMDMGPDGKRPPPMGDPFAGGMAGLRDNGGVGGVESEDMTVPDRMVGLIIGRGGESISRLQAESGAKIQMSPQAMEMSNERLCTLTGSRAAIERAKELINAIVASRANERDRDRMMGGAGGGLGDMMVGGGDQPGQNTAEMIVPSSKVGLIIGKGGETIKQLQDKSGSKMVVIQDGIYANAPEKPLRISGDPKQIEHAKQLVIELMAEKDNFGPPGGRMGSFGGARGFGGGTTSEITVPQAAVGVVIGKGGEMIKKIQNDTGANIQFQQNISGRNERTATVSGTPDQIEHAKVIVQDLIESVMKRDQQMGGFGGGRNGNWGGGGAGGGGGGGFGRGPMGRDGKQEISFPVPANKCGIVIGKGGETIKAINMQSGAHCELDRRPPPNPNEKIFLVKGGPDQVEHAKRLICEKVGIPYGPGGPGGPGGGPGGPGGPFGGPAGPGGPPGGPGGYGPPQGWGNSFHQPGVWGQQQSEPAKQENSWNSYYPQYYGGQGGQAPGAAPRQQPQSSPATGSSMSGQPGQPDYSAQWAEYYRNMGMVREAEAIEQQSKLKAATGGDPGGPPGSAGGGGVQTASNGTQADYSAQWVEYYRSQGLVTEAANLEQQIKLSKQQQSAAAPTSAAGGAPAGYGQPQQHSFASAYGAAAGAPGGYGQYGGYPGAGDN